MYWLSYMQRNRQYSNWEKGLDIYIIKITPQIIKTHKVQLFIIYMSTKQISPLFATPTIWCTFDHQVFWDVVSDRWSKYTVSGGKITSKDDIKPRIAKYLSDKYFTKATHNTYAYRILTNNNILIEAKNDDWETGAGYCILRELQRENLTNIIVVVTRYFGGTQLHADRFRNVVESTKIFINYITKKT